MANRFRADAVSGLLNTLQLPLNEDHAWEALQMNGNVIRGEDGRTNSYGNLMLALVGRAAAEREILSSARTSGLSPSHANGLKQELLHPSKAVDAFDELKLGNFVSRNRSQPHGDLSTDQKKDTILAIVGAADRSDPSGAQNLLNRVMRVFDIYP